MPARSASPSTARPTFACSIGIRARNSLMFCGMGSGFTPPNYGVRSLWTALTDAPFFRIAAEETDRVGEPLLPGGGGMPGPGPAAAAGSGKTWDENRRSKPMTMPRDCSPVLFTHSATPLAQTRTASYVYSSAMRARQPSVPKTILGMWTFLARRHGGVRHGRPPIVEQIGKRAVEMDLRAPAGPATECRGIEGEQRGIARTHPLGIDLEPHRDAREADEDLKDALDRDGFAAADVVRGGALGRESDRRGVCGRDVADGQEVPLRVEAAVPDHRRTLTGLGLRDLLREARGREPRMLPGTVRVGRTEDDGGVAGAIAELPHQLLGRDLGLRVHVRRLQRRTLVDRTVIGNPVHIGARREHEMGILERLERGEDVRRAGHVHRDRAARVVLGERW